MNSTKTTMHSTGSLPKPTFFSSPAKPQQPSQQPGLSDAATDPAAELTPTEMARLALAGDSPWRRGFVSSPSDAVKQAACKKLMFIVANQHRSFIPNNPNVGPSPFDFAQLGFGGHTKGRNGTAAAHVSGQQTGFVGFDENGRYNPRGAVTPKKTDTHLPAMPPSSSPVFAAPMPMAPRNDTSNVSALATTPTTKTMARFAHPSSKSFLSSPFAGCAVHSNDDESSARKNTAMRNMPSIPAHLADEAIRAFGYADSMQAVAEQDNNVFATEMESEVAISAADITPCNGDLEIPLDNQPRTAENHNGAKRAPSASPASSVDEGDKCHSDVSRSVDSKAIKPKKTANYPRKHAKRTCLPKEVSPPKCSKVAKSFPCYGGSIMLADNGTLWKADASANEIAQIPLKSVTCMTLDMSGRSAIACTKIGDVYRVCLQGCVSNSPKLLDARMAGRNIAQVLVLPHELEPGVTARGSFDAAGGVVVMRTNTGSVYVHTERESAGDRCADRRKHARRIHFGSSGIVDISIPEKGNGMILVCATDKAGGKWIFGGADISATQVV